MTPRRNLSTFLHSAENKLAPLCSFPQPKPEAKRILVTGTWLNGSSRLFASGATVADNRQSHQKRAGLSQSTTKNLTGCSFLAEQQQSNQPCLHHGWSELNLLSHACLTASLKTAKTQKHRSTESNTQQTVANFCICTEPHPHRTLFKAFTNSCCSRHFKPRRSHPLKKSFYRKAKPAAVAPVSPIICSFCCLLSLAA